MKRLKILSFLAVAVMAAGTAVGLAGCDLFGGGKTNKISTAEDLINMQSGKNYELTCDIDLNGQIWSPHSINKFNGNGYTIKNVTITQASEGNRIGFFRRVNDVKDVVFDNVNIVASFTDTAIGTMQGAFVSADISNGGNLENITVKNSTMVITSLSSSTTYVGGISAYSGVTAISGCSVENCSISFIAAKGYDDWLFVGGIVGYSAIPEITGCKFTDSIINCKSLSYVNLGGIVGEMKTAGGAIRVTNCISEGNNMTLDMADSKYSSRFGGIVGNDEMEKGEVSSVLSKDNVLKVNARQTYGVGGVIGRNNGIVKNGLADGNTITATLSRNESGSFALAGGFCGINNGTVSRSVSQYNTISGTEFTGTKSACGFSGRSDGSLAYCGVKDNEIEGGDINELTTSSGVVANCLISEEDGDWADVISILNLDTELWEFESGKLKLKMEEII